MDLIDDADPLTREAALAALEQLWRPGDHRRVLARFTNESIDAARKRAGWTLRVHADAASWPAVFEAWRRRKPLPKRVHGTPERSNERST